MGASRQSPEGLKCHVKEGPASNSQSSSTREIRIESLATSSLVMKDKVLTLVFTIFFHRFLYIGLII